MVLEGGNMNDAKEVDLAIIKLQTAEALACLSKVANDLAAAFEEFTTTVSAKLNHGGPAWEKELRELMGNIEIGKRELIEPLQEIAAALRIRKSQDVNDRD